MEWLNSLLPYSDLFSQANIRWSNGDEIHLDLSGLELSDRISACSKLHRQFPDMKFKVLQDGVCAWHCENDLGLLRCVSKDRLTLTECQWQMLPSILSLYNEQVNSQKLNWDIRFSMTEDQIREFRKIELADGLGGFSKPHFSLNARLTPWPQDQFTVRKKNDKHLLALSPGYRDIQDETFKAYCKMMIPERKMLSWSDSFDELRTQGGNMHVTNNLVFIGKDELNKYSSSSNEDEAAERLKMLVFGTAEGKRIIWIGCGDQGPDYRNAIASFQPVYHTDLFFAPLGFVRNNSGKTVLQFIFSSPVIIEESGQTGFGAALTNLQKRFNETLSNLQRQLNEMRITHEFVSIQLPIRVDDSGRIDRYWSFANGLVNRTLERCEFLMPIYVSDTHPTVLNAQMDAIAKITALGWTVIPISGYELDGDAMGSLRCQVKVLGRA